MACFEANFSPSKYCKVKSCSDFIDLSKYCGYFRNGDTFTAVVNFIVCINDDGVVMMNPLRRNYYLCTTKLHLFNVYGFNVRWSVHRKNILIYVQQYATLHSLFYLETALHFFGWYNHPSSGAQTTVSTASGICQTVTATCR